MNRTRAMFQELRGQPAARRRPQDGEDVATAGRGAGRLLRGRSGIRLLSRWRGMRKEGREAEAEAMLPELFLLARGGNAIASGLRTTG